jgi:hypothetical protein
VRGQKQLVVSDFSKGLVLEGDFLRDPTRLRDCLNVVPHEGGGLRSRVGAKRVATPPSGAQIKTLLPVAFGSADYLIAVNDSASSTNGIQRLNVSGGTDDDIASALHVGAGSAAMVSAPASGGQGPVWGLEGSSTPWQYTGSGNVADWTASAGSVPTGDFIVFHANRIWIAGNGTNLNRVYWSSLNSTGGADPRNWSSTAPNDAGSVDIDDANDPITGLGVLGPYVVVFKERKIYLLTDPAGDPGANRKISEHIGCIDWRSIASSPYGLIFQGGTGIFITDGQSARRISRAIDDIWGRLVDPRSGFVGGPGGYWNDNYYIALRDADLGSGYAGNFILNWNAKFDSWWLHAIGANGDVSAAAFAVGPGASRTEELFVAGYHDTTYRSIYSWMMESDFGSAQIAYDNTDVGGQANFPWRAEFGFMDFGQPNVRKRVRELRVDGDISSGTGTGTDLTTEMAFTPSTARDTLTAVEWETQVAGSPSEHRYYTPGIGRMIGLRIRGTGGQQEIHGFTISADLRRD